MHIVMLAGEAVPFAKVGGLADVIGALPGELEKLGATVSVILPRYRAIDLPRFGFRPLPLPAEIRIPLGFESYSCDVQTAEFPDSRVRAYLIGNDQFFGRNGVYLDPVTGKDYSDQADRWIFFQRAAMEFIRAALPSADVLHFHDYHTGLVAAYLRLLYRDDPAFRHTTSVFTLHNLGYQGLFPAETMSRTGFNISEFYPMGPFEFFGRMNFMKTGIVYADVVTTVSETYAREIQSSEFGYGLDGVLRARSEPPVGILNGIDDEAWNPRTDPLLAANFDVNCLDRKQENKKALLRAFGLPESRLDNPLLAMISRIDVQKGFDLVVPMLERLLAQDVTFVLLGTGAREIETRLRAAVKRHADRASLRFSYSNELAHLAEGGADIFLMPSKYEPCGLNQMYSMRYGTVPVVRATGGLADTVQEFDPASGVGTGFRFVGYNVDQFTRAISRALALWRDQTSWRRLMANGMASDFSWRTSAKKYIEVYEKVITRHRP